MTLSITTFSIIECHHGESYYAECGFLNCYAEYHFVECSSSSSSNSSVHILQLLKKLWHRSF
jgi:hypothetical protein